MSSFEIALCVGVIWASILVVWSLAEMTAGDPHPFLLLLTRIYDGYEFTAQGVLIGAMWAFSDGFITGFVISWLLKSILWLFSGEVSTN
ncbi:MAG: hypothetical protein HQM10_01460 [Candidatus Riflebacteria bacterium]|nr:hypothetical protein [Candidatus Riflebacteria bacterium]